MLSFRVPIVYVNDEKVSPLDTKQEIIVTEDAAKKIVEQYNAHPEEIAPVKIGPNTLAIVRSISYDEEKKCIMGDIIMPYAFTGAVYPIQDLQVGNKRRVIDGKLVAVKMTPEQIPTTRPEIKEEA